jgi:hypothetical protein
MNDCSSNRHPDRRPPLRGVRAAVAPAPSGGPTRPRDRLRVLLFFTPWVSVPLACLGVALAVCFPLTLVTPLGWAVYGLAVVAAVCLGAWLRPRYRLSILDSSQLGVLGWLRRR